MPDEQTPNPQSKYETTTNGSIDMGDLRRLVPLTRSFGYDRGQPIDRYYIENFLGKHSDDIKGRVAEIGDDRYTQMFGGGKVASSEVLGQDHDLSNPTIVADLTNAG